LKKIKDEKIEHIGIAVKDIAVSNTLFEVLAPAYKSKSGI
jgi:hypothetical protein